MHHPLKIQQTAVLKNLLLSLVYFNNIIIKYISIILINKKGEIFFTNNYCGVVFVTSGTIFVTPPPPLPLYAEAQQGHFLCPFFKIKKSTLISEKIALIMSIYGLNFSFEMRSKQQEETAKRDGMIFARLFEHGIAQVIPSYFPFVRECLSGFMRVV